MKSIYTRSAEYLTGSEIADAVQAYAVALANAGRIDAVEIPIVVVAETRRAQFMVGASRETWIMTASSYGINELSEPATVFELQDRTRSTGRLKAQPFSAEEIESMPPFDLDFYRNKGHGG